MIAQIISHLLANPHPSSTTLSALTTSADLDALRPLGRQHRLQVEDTPIDQDDEGDDQNLRATKKKRSFRYTSWFIGILIMVYYIPYIIYIYIWVVESPIYPKQPAIASSLLLLFVSCLKLWGETRADSMHVFFKQFLGLNGDSKLSS